MKINGAKIFNDGVWIDKDCEEKIQHIVNAFNMRLSGRFTENKKIYSFNESPSAMAG